MTPGVYKAKVINCGITSSKDGNPQVTINLKLLMNEGAPDQTTQDMMWSGSLKEGRAQEITLDAVLVCGYKENNLNLLAEGKGLDLEKVVQVTVESESYNGRDTLKIKWINEVGSGASKEFMAKNDAILKLTGLKIEGSLMERKQLKGLAPAAQESMPGYDAKNVPF